MSRITRFVLIAGILAGGHSAARAAEAVAEAWAVDGQASVEGRSLQRGDSVHSGEAVRTGADSRAGLFAGELYVQLDPESLVRFERGPDGQVVVALEVGRARIIDTRAEGAVPASIRAGGGVAAVTGGDTEVYVLQEKAGRYAMFCDWDRPLQIARHSHQLGIGPGDCALVKPGEAPYVARGHDHQIPLMPLQGVGPRGLPDVAAGHFNVPVAAALGLPAFLGPLDAGGLPRDPCDNPGSGCAGGPRGGLLNVVDPAPDVGFCAPGVACGPNPAVIDPAPNVGLCAPGVACGTP
jgi:hypothetical protein